MAKRQSQDHPSQGKAAGCVFCRIIAGDEDAKVVFEDAISVAFLDVRPLFPGHCLLITKQHYETLTDIPRDLVGPLFLNVQLLAGAVQEVMNGEGTFVAINNKISQSVPHFHVHVVPRRRGDGLRGFFWPRQRYSESEMNAVQEALSVRLAATAAASSRGAQTR